MTNTCREALKGNDTVKLQILHCVDYIYNVPTGYISISQKGCFSDACFINRNASCSLNLWLLSYMSLSKIKCIFFDFVFSWSAFSKKSDQYILFIANMTRWSLWNMDHAS